MNKVVEVLQLVRDELGMSEDAEIRYTDDGRWLCSDAFTFILASKKHQDISFWAEMHKKYCMSLGCCCKKVVQRY